eukprot:COSAG01_NODE_34_length_34978_cov_45.798475_26_plen_211_part_00
MPPVPIPIPEAVQGGTEGTGGACLADSQRPPVLCRDTPIGSGPVNSPTSMDTAAAAAAAAAPARRCAHGIPPPIPVVAALAVALVAWYCRAGTAIWLVTISVATCAAAAAVAAAVAASEGGRDVRSTANLANATARVSQEAQQLTRPSSSYHLAAVLYGHVSLRLYCRALLVRCLHRAGGAVAACCSAPRLTRPATCRRCVNFSTRVLAY